MQKNAKCNKCKKMQIVCARRRCPLFSWRGLRKNFTSSRKFFFALQFFLSCIVVYYFGQLFQIFFNRTHRSKHKTVSCTLVICPVICTCVSFCNHCGCEIGPKTCICNFQLSGSGAICLKPETGKASRARV